MQLSVNSGDETVAVVSPGSVTFTDCDQRIPIKVTPVGAGGPVEIFLGEIANDTAMKFSLATARFNVWVDPAPDSVPPVLHAPDQVVVNATSPSGATVAFTVTAEDAKDPTPVVECDPVSGSRFAIGTTGVDCVATDDSGNAGHATFTVKVKGAPEQIADLADKLRAIRNLAPLQTALRAYLERMADYAIRYDTNRACTYADLLLTGVKYAVSKKWLTSAQGADLTADIKRIKAVIGCRAG